jgi:galactokinase
MLDAGYPLKGIDAVFSSDIPIGAGVSSSAAIEMAFVLAWENLSNLSLDGVTRARLGRRTENSYLGLASGIMDQFASLHGAADRLILLDCRTLEYRLIPLPAGTTILVADTGIRHELANSAYNQRRRECQQALEALQVYLPSIRALRDITPANLEEFGVHLPDIPRRRAQHVVDECARVLEGARALEMGNLDRFGDAIRRSHASARDLYEISIPELNVLAEAAWAVPGCYGARLTGGGFGGCVVALADLEQAGSVSEAMKEAFEDRFGRRPSIFACRVDGGANASPTGKASSANREVFFR